MTTSTITAATAILDFAAHPEGTPSTQPFNIFNHPQFGQLRTITHTATGDYWFVAKDVADMLGYRNPAEAIREHCKKVNKITQPSKTLGCPPTNITIIPESDVYRLIIRSKLSAAEKFEAWVMEEVLPAIRQHGMYATPATVDAMLADPETAIKMLTAFKQEQQKRVDAEKKLAEAAPKAALVDVAFSKRSEQGLKLTEVVRKFGHVNTQRIKRDLCDLGYLYKTKAQYRVYAKWRDSHFVERWDSFSGKQDIYATPKGAALIAQLYYEGNLSMKGGR